MVEHSDIYRNLDCFTSFQNSLLDIAKTYYFGLTCKLRGEGQLLTIWFDLVKVLISHGKVAVVYYAGKLTLAQVVGGYQKQGGEWVDLKVLFFGDRKDQEFTPGKGQYVVFQWGAGHSLSFSELKHDILEMWYLKGLIGWDQEKSKKKIMVEFEKDPGKDGWKDPMNSYEHGFIGIIAPSKSTNEIKKWQFLESKNNVERQQLWKDYREVESRFFFKLGIRHNPFAKEERQNNPEIMSGQSYFDAWEIEHQEGVIQGILEFSGKEWGGGKYSYQFGSLPTLLIVDKTMQPLALAQQQQNWFSQIEKPFLESKNN